MNFEKVQRKNRKAISPVLATVILIAITLIAAIAVAGFVFGLFGTFTATAQVSAASVSCVYTTGVCTLVLSNTGNSPVTITSCAFTGAAVNGGGPGTESHAGNSLAPGATDTSTCTAGTKPTSGAGTEVTGSVGLSNGGQALFSGIWQ